MKFINESEHKYSTHSLNLLTMVFSLLAISVTIVEHDATSSTEE